MLQHLHLQMNNFIITHAKSWYFYYFFYFMTKRLDNFHSPHRAHRGCINFFWYSKNDKNRYFMISFNNFYEYKVENFLEKHVWETLKNLFSYLYDWFLPPSYSIGEQTMSNLTYLWWALVKYFIIQRCTFNWTSTWNRQNFAMETSSLTIEVASISFRF